MATDRNPPARGRRPGENTTRRRILDTAREHFADRGFGATTIRGVAAAAEVDPALVLQFFGSKNHLFAAALEIPEYAMAHLDAAFDGPSDSRGQRLVRTFLELWEDDPSTSGPLVAMVRGAVVNDQAREQLREFIQDRLAEGPAGRGSDTAVRRAAVASSMLVGLVMARRIIGVPQLVAAEREELVALAAPAIQHVLDGG